MVATTSYTTKAKTAKSVGSPRRAPRWKSYLIFEPNTAVLSTNRQSFSGNDFSTGFIAREAFYTI